MSDGYARGFAPYTEEQRQRDMERVREADEKRARERAAWDRLCGSVAPIGRAVVL